MVGLLASLQSYASEVTDEAAAKARGLLNQFQQGTTAFGFKVAVLIFSRLEQLNKSLQSASSTVSGMIAAAESVVLELRRLYDQIFSLMPYSVTQMKWLMSMILTRLLFLVCDDHRKDS